MRICRQTRGWEPFGPPVPGSGTWGFYVDPEAMYRGEGVRVFTPNGNTPAVYGFGKGARLRTDFTWDAQANGKWDLGRWA